jgi:hypothetical protein
MPSKKDTTRINDLLASVTADMLDGGPQLFQDNSRRVERILLEMVRPDPVQPRHVLPEQIHIAFHNQRLTPTQALKQLVQLMQVAARQQGQPFQNVVEPLPNADDEREEDVETKLSPSPSHAKSIQLSVAASLSLLS